MNRSVVPLKVNSLKEFCLDSIRTTVTPRIARFMKSSTGARLPLQVTFTASKFNSRLLKTSKNSAKGINKYSKIGMPSSSVRLFTASLIESMNGTLSFNPLQRIIALKKTPPIVPKKITNGTNKTTARLLIRNTHVNVSLLALDLALSASA